MTWSGPNLPADTKSVLNLQKINRNQAGNYQCTASNDVSSKTSVVVNVVLQCKYILYMYYYLTCSMYMGFDPFHAVDRRMLIAKQLPSNNKWPQNI